MNVLFFSLEGWKKRTTTMKYSIALVICASLIGSYSVEASLKMKAMGENIKAKTFPNNRLPHYLLYISSLRNKLQWNTMRIFSTKTFLKKGMFSFKCRLKISPTIAKKNCPTMQLSSWSIRNDQMLLLDFICNDQVRLKSFVSPQNQKTKGKKSAWNSLLQKTLFNYFVLMNELSSLTGYT